MSEEDDLGGLHADLAASSISECASGSSKIVLACFLTVFTPCISLINQLSTRSHVDLWLTL